MNFTSWGQYPNLKIKAVTYSWKNLAEIFNVKKTFIPYGNGRSYGDSALNHLVLNMRPHDYFKSFNEESGLLHVESGVLLCEILEHFVPRGWFLKVTPGTKLITVGGAIASDVHGKNHHIMGCFSECVKEFDIVLAGGTIVTCSKTQHAELFHATCGGMGLTGVIVNAKIYLKKIKSQFINQTTIKNKNLKETFESFEKYRSSSYSVAWIDCFAKKENIGRSLLKLGEFGCDDKLQYIPKEKVSVPLNFPSFILNKISMSLFNWFYYKKTKGRVSNKVVDIDSFFYPLDAIKYWNRIYGKNGFVQYQCILPKEKSFDGLTEILSKISNSKRGSFLAVLKLYGKANGNYLSFPMEGYSLALDFKIDKGIWHFLNELDEILKKYEGRVYLAKDARITKENFEQGYPLVDKFRTFRKKNQMDKVFQSLQSERLGI
ncbi:FAD-binding oxidoreductase [Aliikangiella maris]|uniref:FAD-binding oxidoreductase n=2 Tax=Aliikangiella maris TaxID=3162458 RepID=A0ABV2BVX6_9GAMM